MRISVCPWHDSSAHLENRQDFLNAFGEGTRFSPCFDRSIQGSAKTNAKTAGGTAAGYGAEASQIGSSVIPGLERDANSPTGLTPEQRSAYLVSGAEAVGGANAGLTGEAKLAAARTHNAGGFAPALAEAARIKSRALATNEQNVNKTDTQIALEKQQQARQLLSGLYGTNVNAQLHGMGIQNEDLNTALQAGKSGWQQNAMNWIDTVSGARKAFGGGGGGGGESG